MSASTSDYPSAFPSEWISPDEDDRITTRSRSRSRSPPSRDDTTPTPAVRAPLEPIPMRTPSSEYLDHFPNSWALPDSESSPPSTPLRDVDTARLNIPIESNTDILKARHDRALSAEPPDRFQTRSASIGDANALFALQGQRRRNSPSNDLSEQRRNTGDWLLQIAGSQSIPMRQNFLVGRSNKSTRMDLEIKPQNLLWLERLKEIKALKAESLIGQGQSEEDNQHDDGDEGDMNPEGDECSDSTASYAQSESGYGDVPHRRSMSDSYSTYTDFSITH